MCCRLKKYFYYRIFFHLFILSLALYLRQTRQMAEIKITLSREQVEAEWQDATGRSDPLSDETWRKFSRNAQRQLDVRALLAACGVIDAAGGGGAAAAGGGGGAAAAGGGGGAVTACEFGSVCHSEGCGRAHLVRGPLASVTLVFDGNLSWCALHRKWHSDDKGVFCLNRGWTVSSDAMAKRIHEFRFDAAELRRVGISAVVLRTGGYNAGEMKAGGYTFAELKAGGYNVGEMKASGYTFAELKAGGYNAGEMKAGGYNAGEMKAGGYTLAELEEAGYYY